MARCKAFSHSAMRAQWRYGITIKYRQYKILCERIKNKQSAEFLWELTSTRAVWLIEHRVESLFLAAIWDSKSELIVTFLPIEALRKFVSESSKTGVV